MGHWRAVNALFLVATALDSLAMGHLTAFTPLYLRELGLAPGDVGPWTGFLYATMMAIAFPLAPFWGALAERYSRRLMIVRGQYLGAAAYALTAFAPDVSWLLPARLLLGCTFGSHAMIIATQALLTPRRHVGSAIATIQIAMPIAASFGPPLGAILVELIGLRGLFLLDAALALVSGLLVTFLMPEPPSQEKPASILGRTLETGKLVWGRRAIRWDFLAWFLSHGARAIVDVYLPVRIGQLVADPAPAIGLILGVYGVLTTVSTWLAGRLVDETGGIRWLWPAMAVATVATFGLTMASQLWVVALLAWSRAFPFAASNILLYAHLVRILPAAEQTSVMALSPMPRNMAAFVLPLVAAAVAPFGASAALAVGAAAYGGTAVVGWLVDRETGREREGRSMSAEE
ncbi:MAG TPA: MFS transporter [Chloroflexota bacterium]|nr:MFS transporter [Chloroflexota bacterium]